VSYRKLIANARLVSEGRIQEGDLLVEGQRITRIGGALSADNAEIIDAEGRLLMPGMIDDQVHFREPGLEHKGCIASESRAAVAGGITSYMEMPNCIPATTSQEAVEAKHLRAASDSVTNYGFYLGATNTNLEAIKSIDPRTVCGIKVFMGASTGNLLVDDRSVLEQIFAHAPVLVATHCEDTPTIQANNKAAMEKYGDDVPVTAHPWIRSHEACLKSSTLAVDLARRHGTRLHVLHLTTADELELFESGPCQDKQITAEVCVHHLFFNDTWYAAKGNFIKCNPAIKSASDQAALQKALRENRLDVIATDHAPHTLAEKQQPYMQAPAGLPLVQHALLVLLELAHGGCLPLPQIVNKACHAPADLFRIPDRGYLREGYFADLVLVDDRSLYRVDDEPLFAKCDWSPFSGFGFRSRIDRTWINGHLVWEQGTHHPAPPGLRLTYAR